MGKKIKRGFVLLAMVFFISGCGAAARESGFYEHDTMYRNWDHTRFSWTGYRNPTAEASKNSMSQGWWGLEIPYMPAK